MDVERMEGLVREHERLRGAFLTHYAVCNPPALNDELDAFREGAGLTMTRDDAMAQAQATVEALSRARQQKLLGAPSGD